jgi:hypothetical protein
MRQHGFRMKYFVIAIIAIIVILFFINLNRGSVKRSLVDLKSEWGNGLQREITVYTADGQVLAHYEGKIDLDSTNGVVKFDFDGKRYIYYNCYVETIANID